MLMIGTTERERERERGGKEEREIYLHFLVDQSNTHPSQEPKQSLYNAILKKKKKMNKIQNLSTTFY